MAISTKSLAVILGLAISTSAAAAPDYPLFGDINGDCIVDKFDIKTIKTVATTPGVRVKFDTDLNNDGVTDMYDAHLAVGASTSTCGRRLIGDVNGDGIVGAADTMAVLGGFGATGINALDIDGDQNVNQVDLDMISAQMGDTLGRRVLGDVNGDYVVNSSDILDALTQVGSSLDTADLNRDGAVNSYDINAIGTQVGETACSQMSGDANGDRKVDVYDLILVYMSIGSSLVQFDCNQDGEVSVADYDIVNDNIGLTAGVSFTGDVNGDWEVNDMDVELIEATYGSTWTQADLNESGSVDSGDILDVNSAYGTSTGGELDGDVDNNCVVDAQDVNLIAAFLGQDFAPADLNGDGLIGVYDDLLVANAYSGNTCE